MLALARAYVQRPTRRPARRGVDGPGAQGRRRDLRVPRPPRGRGRQPAPGRAVRDPGARRSPTTSTCSTAGRSASPASPANSTPTPSSPATSAREDIDGHDRARAARGRGDGGRGRAVRRRAAGHRGCLARRDHVRRLGGRLWRARHGGEPEHTVGVRAGGLRPDRTGPVERGAALVRRWRVSLTPATVWSACPG